MKKRLFIATLIGSMMLTGCSFSFSIGNDDSKNEKENRVYSSSEVEVSSSSDSTDVIVEETPVAETDSGTKYDGSVLSCTFNGVAFEFQSPEQMILDSYDDEINMSAYRSASGYTTLSTIGLNLENVTVSNFDTLSLEDWAAYVSTMTSLSTIKTSEYLDIKSGIKCVRVAGKMDGYSEEMNVYLFPVADEQIGLISIVSASTEAERNLAEYKQAIVDSLKTVEPTVSTVETTDSSNTQEETPAGVEVSTKSYTVKDFSGNSYSFYLPEKFVNEMLYESETFITGYTNDNDMLTIKGYNDSNYLAMATGGDYQTFENRTYTVLSDSISFNGVSGYLIRDSYNDGEVTFDTYVFETGDDTVSVEYRPMESSSGDEEAFQRYLKVIFQ